MSLSLPTFVIGPESQGRGYRLLQPASSDLPRPTDLAMVLMEWARTGEAEFVGGYPLDGGAAVVFRARSLGKAMHGDAAFLHGVIVSRAAMDALGGRPEALLAHIPPPDGSTAFAEQPLSVEPAPFKPFDWPDLGLAWRDRLILHPGLDGEDRVPERLLVQALASIDPPEQRARIGGWVSSGRLVSRGGLNLLASSQLVVAQEPFEGDLPAHLPFRFPGMHSPDVEPPTSWTTWRAVVALAGERPAYARLASALVWRPAYARLTPAATVEEALGQASAVLTHGQMVDLMLDLLGKDGDFARGAATIAPEYMAALRAKGLADQSFPRLLETVVLQDDAEVARAVGALLGLADPAAIAALGEDAFLRMLPHALAVIASERAATDAAVRAGVLATLDRIVDERPAGDSAFAIVRSIIDAWPKTVLGELVPLTAPARFRLIWSKSQGVGLTLANIVIKSRNFAAGAGPVDPQLYLKANLAAQRELRGR